MDNTISKIRTLRPYDIQYRYSNNIDDYYIHRIEKDIIKESDYEILCYNFNGNIERNIKRSILIKKEIDKNYIVIINKLKSIDKILGISFIFIYIPLILDIIVQYKWLIYLYYGCIGTNSIFFMLYYYIYIKVDSIKKIYNNYNNIYDIFDNKIVNKLESIFVNINYTNFISNNENTEYRNYYNTFLNEVLGTQLMLLYKFESPLQYKYRLYNIKTTLVSIDNEIINLSIIDINNELDKEIKKMTEYESLKIDEKWNSNLKKYLNYIKYLNIATNIFNLSISLILTIYTIIYDKNNGNLIEKDITENNKKHITNILIIWFFMLILYFSILHNFSNFVKTVAIIKNNIIRYFL